MRANEVKLLEFIKKSPQLIVPLYQRNYSWGRKECLQLWEDITKAGSDDNILGHFVGSIVYIQEHVYQVSDKDPLLVIDGQQRLTSVILIIAALVELLDDDSHSDWFNAKRFQDFYLFNPHEFDEMKYKLLLSKTDKRTLASIVSRESLPFPSSTRIKENYNLFKELISGYPKDKRLIFQGLLKLLVVDIALDRNQDNPQLIFESMNSKGKPLSQADLIRNFVLMGLSPEEQKRLYEDLWYPMEEEFGQEDYNKHFDKFMRYFLTMQDDRKIPKENEVYIAFKKKYASSKSLDKSDAEAIVKKIRRFSSHYCKIVLEQETDSVLKPVFIDLNELKVTPVYPFLMEIYDDFVNEKLSKDHLIEIVRFAEAYIFRRSICDVPTNRLKNCFATFTKDLPNNENSLKNIKARFLSLRSTERLPNDKEFSEALKIRDMYNNRLNKYWLRRLENFDRKEIVKKGEYTIEHIMPQGEPLSPRWQNDLGTDWKRIHQEYIHSIGNLTLTGYNSEYSNKPFLSKRDMKGGFRESPLRLNSGLGQIMVWNEEEILKRTERLVGYALKVWPLPQVSDRFIQKFNKSVKTKQEYSIDDHPKLKSTLVHPLFEEFRRKVLEIDPLIREEYQKKYVTYKLYSNVVDLIPLSEQLKLTLNTSIDNLYDPRQMGRDISQIGRWGNGEVEVKLGSFTDVPYVIGLVSQVADLQLEDNAA